MASRWKAFELSKMHDLNSEKINCIHWDRSIVNLNFISSSIRGLNSCSSFGYGRFKETSFGIDSTDSWGSPLCLIDINWSRQISTIQCYQKLYWGYWISKKPTTLIKAIHRIASIAAGGLIRSQITAIPYKWELSYKTFSVKNQWDITKFQLPIVVRSQRLTHLSSDENMRKIFGRM